MFYPDKNVIICKSPFMNTGRDNPQYSFEETCSDSSEQFFTS